MSENRYSMMDLPIWHYEGVLKNTKVSAQNILAAIILSSSAERLYVYHVSIGQDDYAAGRNNYFEYRQSKTSGNLYLVRDTIDNEDLWGPALLVHDDKTADTIRQVGVPMVPFPMTEQSDLRAIGTSLVQNEEMTFRISAYHHSLGSEKPTVTLGSSDATLTEVVNVIK